MQRSFNANQEITFEKVWDTEEFAWSDGIAKVDPWEVAVVVDGHDTLTKEIVVRPRPLILVHGIWSNAETWEEYGPVGLSQSGGFVRGAHANWRAYAVGDGFVPDLAMHTASWVCALPGAPPTCLFAVWSYERNARVLADYIAAVRSETQAWRWISSRIPWVASFPANISIASCRRHPG